MDFLEFRPTTVMKGLQVLLSFTLTVWGWWRFHSEAVTIHRRMELFYFDVSRLSVDLRNRCWLSHSVGEMS